MITVDDDHDAASLFDQRSVIRGLATGCIRSAQHRSTESLRCLHGHQCGPIRGGYHRAIGLHDFDRVGHGNTGHGCVCSSRDSGNHTLVHRGRRKWAGGIMHTDNCCIVRHRRKTCPNRRRPRISARNCTLSHSIARRHDNHDTGAHLLGDGFGMVDHTTVADQLILLWFAESLTASTTDNNSPNCFCMLHSLGG